MNKHGGARPGAGRKAVTKKYSDAFKADVFKSLKKIAAEKGKTIGEVIAELAFSDDSKHFNIRPIALKMIQEILVIKETRTEQDVAVQTNIGPTIGLPPLLPKPKEEEETAQVVH